MSGIAANLSEVYRSAKPFDEAAQHLDDALAQLARVLDGASLFYGADEYGASFAATYLPALMAAFDATNRLHASVGATATGVTDMAKTLQAASELAQQLWGQP